MRSSSWINCSTLGVVLVLCGALAATVHADLIWSDEFNGTTLDPNNWEPMIGNGDEYGLPGWGNNEWEYYTSRPENLFVDGGYLHIVAREENYAGFAYTSARIRTRHRQEFLYGRLEGRIRLPQGGAGIWPAFWMLPTDSPYGGWAASGEIDILETVGVPLSAHGTLIYGGGWPNQVYNGSSYSIGTSFANGFHVYTLEWTQDEMRWFIDGVQYHSVTSDDWYSDAAPGNNRAPFDVPFHFLLNVAVGGNWPGPPDATTPFPQEMLVDWVRVYDFSSEPPTVTIDTPADGAELPAGVVVITATASDPEGALEYVNFYANDELIAQDGSAPFAVGWDAPDGCHRIRAVAVDVEGWTGEDEVQITVGAGCAGDPYLGYPAALPGTVECENYDHGGEGVAYHDCDSSNHGGEYRPLEGVDIQAASGSDYNVGWMCNGEWLNYTVDVTQPGYYHVEARVASQNSGGTFALEFDGFDRTGNIAVPVTGGWQDWVVIDATMELSAGLQELRFVNRSSNDEFNIDRLIFTYHDTHDCDFDGDVDVADCQAFAGCMSGPDSSVPQGDCAGDNFGHSDADDDADADLADLANLQRAVGLGM